MSNPFKAIGKVFKGIVKVVKKVALPALAIGAAVLTGGAALGILPSIGAVGSSLGLSAGLTSVLSTAGTGALLGAGTAAITGGNILKGATSGFVVGGVTGGIGQMMKGATAVGSAASNGAKAAGTIANGVDDIVVTGGKAFGAGSAATSAMPGIAAMSGQSVTQPQTGDVVSSVASPAAPVNSAAPSAITQPVASAQGGSFLNGIGSFIERNPYVTAGLVQGLGNGLSASAQAKEQRRTEEERVARIADNYGGFTGFQSENYAAPIRAEAPRMIWQIDPKTGNVYRKVEGQA